MRKTLTTAALVLAFSFPALAGEIHTPPVAPPDSTQEQSTDAVTTDGLIQTLLDVIVSVLP